MNGIQEVSGSIPLISTTPHKRMQKTAETGRFQRSFRFCRTRFSLLFCALDFDQKILNQGDRKMKKIKMNQERLWKPISSTCAPYPSTRAFRKAMRTTAASVSLRASSSASHMRLPVRFSQSHIQTGRHPLKPSILHKLSQGALWRMEVFLLFPSSRQNRTQSVSLSAWLSNRCSLSWVLRRSWPPTVKGVLSAICPMRPNMNTGRISNSPYPWRSLMICSLSRFKALILQPDTPSSLLRQGIVSFLARFSWFSSFAAFTPSEQAKVSEKSF